MFDHRDPCALLPSINTDKQKVEQAALAAKATKGRKQLGGAGKGGLSNALDDYKYADNDGDDDDGYDFM